MNAITLMDKYPVQTLTISKSETTYQNIDAILGALETLIQNHPVATYIATFDHYTHTTGLSNGEVNPSIKDAKNIIFCFGVQLPKAEMLAIRPRAIGVAEMEDGFTLSFMDAPNPQAQEAMIQWVESIKNV